jgi:hypothetical protein
MLGDTDVAVSTNSPRATETVRGCVDQMRRRCLALREGVARTPPRKPDDDRRWAEFEAKSDLPEIQERIRREIAKGTIRVRPTRAGSIRIVSQEGQSRSDPG